jgi:hypothetical protein
MKISLLLLVVAMSASAQNNSTPLTGQAPSPDQRAAEIRTACINGRRAVCGKVIKILPDGLVVDSGYTGLLEAPFNQSWVVTGGASLSRDPKVMELNKPASTCVGLVFLTDIPKRPAVKLYDYVVLQAYPAGQFIYVPVAGVQKTIRKFSAGIDTAVKLNLDLQSRAAAP